MAKCFFNTEYDKINVFLRFFTIISILADFERNNSTDLFVEYFCEFFDTPGTPVGIQLSHGWNQLRNSQCGKLLATTAWLLIPALTKTRNTQLRIICKSPIHFDLFYRCLSVSRCYLLVSPRCYLLSQRGLRNKKTKCQIITNLHK